MDRLAGRDFGLSPISNLGLIHSQVAQRITWHAHDGYQLLFLLRGATAYEFKHQGRKRVDLPGGHFLLIPGRMVHRGVQDMRPPCALCSIVLAAGGKWSRRTSPFTPTEWKWIEQQFRRAQIAVRPLTPELRRAITALVREVQSFSRRRQAPLIRARVRTRVCEVLIEAAGQLTAAAPMISDNVVAAAESYLRQHLADGVVMPDVARHLGLSRTRLFDLFKRATGMTPNDYLVRARVEKARELLTRSSTPVTEIAFEAGFASSQYFSTVFRKYVGQTPVAYRKEQAGQ